MPLPGALLDSDDDDVPSTVAAPGTPKVVAPGVGRAAQSHTDESLSQQYIGHGRLSSLIQTTDSAASDDSTRNVRARTEVPGAGNSLPGMAAVSTPMALSRTPSTGWGVGLVAVTPMAAPATPTATPTATPAASATAKVSSVLSPQNSPKAIQAPSRITAEPLSRTGSSEGSDSDGGEGLSKGILADRIESVQREIDQLNAEIQRMQQDMERNPSPPPTPVCKSPLKQSAAAISASTAVDQMLAPPSPSPTPSPSPPRHFSTRAVIDSDLVSKIYAENQAHRARAYCDIDAMLGLPNRAVLTSETHVFDPYSLGMAGDEPVMYAHVQDSPFFAANIRRFAQVKHLIVEKVREAYQKRQKLIHKAVRLERRLREAAVHAGVYEAPPVESDACIRTPRLRREVTAISTESLTPKAGGAAVGFERSERRVSRNSCAVIPPMLTEQEKKAVAIDNRNTIDPDPLLSLQIRKLSNAWSDEEHAAFFERFAAHDKQFHKIAEFLVNKTCNDVVEFYYRNKNRSAFKHRLKLINRLKERSLPFLRYGSHDAMLSNLRDGAVATYVATRPGSDAFIWFRQRHAEEQEVARAEAELGRLIRELAARKEENIKAANPPIVASKNEKAKSSGKASKEKEKKDGGLLNDKDSRVSICGKEKVKGNSTLNIKVEQTLGDTGASSSDIGVSAHAEELVRASDAQASTFSGVSSAGNASELQAFDSALSKKISKPRAIGWSPDEESVFVAYMQAHGKDWKKISSLMPGKSQVALRQQFKKMSEQGQLPDSLVKTERSTVGGGALLPNPAKNAKAQARRMQQLTVSATATELVEAGTEHFALRDLSQVDSQQLGHLFMMHMMQQLQNSQGSDADRAQLAQIVNTLQEHRSQTFLQLIHEAAQLLVNQQAEAAAAAGANLDGGAGDDDAADEDDEGEGDDSCANDRDVREAAGTEGQHDAQNDSVADLELAVGSDNMETSATADGAAEMQEDEPAPTDGRADDDDMNEASGGESQPEIKDDGAHSDTNADTEPAVGNDDMEASAAADGAAEMQEDEPAPTGATFDEVPVEGLESMDTSDYIAESCSDTHQNIASE